MSSAGTSICRRAIVLSVVSSGTPPSMKAMSALVPPMSRVTTLVSPRARAMCSVAVIPPAGPDITVWIGASAAAPESIAPPFDFINVHSRVMPESRSAPSRLAT